MSITIVTQKSSHPKSSKVITSIYCPRTKMGVCSRIRCVICYGFGCSAPRWCLTSSELYLCSENESRINFHHQKFPMGRTKHVPRALSRLRMMSASGGCVCFDGSAWARSSCPLLGVAVGTSVPAVSQVNYYSGVQKMMNHARRNMLR